MLPAFDITFQEETMWFAITEGPCKGAMFRIPDEEEAPYNPEDPTAIAVDIAFNKMWEGDEASQEAAMPQINEIVSKFITVAVEATIEQVESGQLKLDLENVDASV